mgnify:CR=1 FL=1
MDNNRTTSVLCTNGILSKTLAAVRSLGSHGIRTVASEKNRFHPSGFSKHCARSLISPNPRKNPDLYLEWLVETIHRENCNVLFAMDDDTMDIAVNHRKELESICRVPVPSKESYIIAADKGKTIQLAQKANVPCPLTLEFDFQNGVNKANLFLRTFHMQYPLVIKPRHSSGSRGIRFVHNREQLLQTVKSIHLVYPNPIIQEYIPPGDKYDVCLCYDANHQLKASFIQKQIRNYPIGKGPSSVHESVKSSELLGYAVKLMENIPWYGVADIEFMIDPRDGQPKLMEINPRFWSSVHLSVRCGVDFPWILYQLALGNDIDPISDYVVGKRGRSLLPGDVLHFLSNPDRMQMDPKFWNTKIPDDIISWEDPLPTVGFLLYALRYGFNLNTWKFLIRR